MSFQTVIPCPDCGSDIHIDSQLLISGEGFKCVNPNCTVSVSLDQSSASQVSEAFSKFEKLKKDCVEQSQEIE